VASSSAALSRTETVMSCSATQPLIMSPYSGPSGTRAPVGLNPINPHAEAGNRNDPDRSLPCAIGTIPDATAEADPPEDPLVERLGSHVLRVAPNSTGSVAGGKKHVGPP
jgi:hypothetical protein